MGYTLRVGRAGVAEEGVHLTGQQPEVGTVVFDAVALRLEVAAGRDHVHVGGSDALDFLEQMRIDAKLQDRRRTGIAGEFRVVDLVGPVAETAGRRYLQQEVPAPRPFVVRKGCLVNDVHASAHLGDGRPNVAPRSVYDGAALAPQPVEIGLLVLHAPLAQVFEHRAVSEWRPGRPPGGCQIENGKVSARQEVAEVGRGQAEAVGCLVHGLVPSSRSERLKPQPLRSRSAGAWRASVRRSDW